MKLKINKKLKIALISLLTIIILFTSYLLYKELNTPIFKEQKNPVYTYSNKSSINYEVFLRPNKLYETSTLGEGKLYITEFIDHIKTDLNYEFIGERIAEISGSYDIVAKVQGYSEEREKTINIWERDFPIVSNKRFNTKENTIAVNEKVSINLEEYNAFAKEIIETSKINCQTSLNIIMNVDLEGNTDRGPIEETISTSLVIPLNVLMFEITGNASIDKPGAIEETIKIQLPINKNKVIMFGIIIGILLIALIYLSFFTVPAPVKDPLEKELGRIFKKHGDRIVALNNDIEIKDINLNFVKSFEDLLRIADEVNKPILYKYSKDYKEISKFYIAIEDGVYILDLCELVPEEVDNEQLTVNSEQQAES